MNKITQAYREGIEEFENKFVNVAPEEDGSTWKRKSNPDDAPAFLQDFARKLIAAARESIDGMDFEMTPKEESMAAGMSEEHAAVVQINGLAYKAALHDSLAPLDEFLEEIK